MFDTSVLNVVIGLILIFLLYSLLATILLEAFSMFRQRRARMLFRGIKSMLTNTPDRRLPTFVLLLDYLGLYRFTTRFRLGTFWIWHFFKTNKNAKLKRLYSRYRKRIEHENATVCLYDRFYDHAIIKNFGQNFIYSKPSYITSDVFSSVLIEVIKDTNEDNVYKTATFPLIKNAFESTKNEMESDVVKILTYHFNEAAGDVDVFKRRLEGWFNDTMDRVSGWYKRATQIWLFVLGILLTILFNVDTIEITKFLSANKRVAEQLANIGGTVAKDASFSGQEASSEEVQNKVKAQLANVYTIVGLGWGNYGGNTNFWGKISYVWQQIGWKKFIGFIITALAIGLGAPFWFDLLNKFVNLRTAVKVVDSSGSTTKNNVSSNNPEFDG